MDLSLARSGLVQEARELLRDMEKALLEIEAQGSSPETINAVFRAAHTIKGSAGLFGLTLIVGFTQLLESVLDLVRSGRRAVDDAFMTTMLDCADYLDLLVDAIEQGTESVDPEPTLRHALMAKLRVLLAANSISIVPVTPTKLLPRKGLRPSLRSELAHWHISLRFSPEVMKRGMDPLSFIVYLRSLGEIVYLHTLTSDLPPLEKLDPELSCLGFEVGLSTSSDQETLERAFEIVREESEIRILPPRSSVAEYLRLIEDLPNDQQLLGEILVAAGALNEEQLHEALLLQQSLKSGPQRLRLGEVLVQQELVPEKVVAAALSKQQQVDERKVQEQRIVKVEASKLDLLINLVGELVIASEGARTTAARAKSTELVEALAKMKGLVENVRDSALNMRMTPIGDVFQRFPRVVRDVAKELDKQIQLSISGAEAELDKSMVDRLADPLLHIVRNAIDHGIEPVAERIARGKAAQGNLRLHAYHESGCIVVEVSDDGRGLDPERIREKAVERGLVAANAQLSTGEIYQLLFLPGFSTASQVTHLSGRGVGMDVVKRNVEQLRGEIELESDVGHGTTMRIRLPLTLAIIDGFQVAIGRTVFVIPLDAVVECVDMVTAQASQNIINLRGSPLPYLRLRDVFGIAEANNQRESLVVVSYGQQRVGLVVDRLLGDSQAVIKPLGQLFRGIKAVSSSTILGDGSVALILDVHALVATALNAAHMGPARRETTQLVDERKEAS